jgi:hypothetical protein
MLFEDVVEDMLYWLMEGEQRVVKVKVSKKNDDDTITVRLPNGALQSVFSDELGE